MRSIYYVIEKMKAKVPDDWEGRKDLFAAFDDVIDSAAYRAPEAYFVNFEQTAMVLEQHLGEPDEDWKKKIGDIFADKA